MSFSQLLNNFFLVIAVILFDARFHDLYQHSIFFLLLALRSFQSTFFLMTLVHIHPQNKAAYVAYWSVLE